MINSQIVEAFVSIAKDKNIDRTNLNTVIEELFMNLIKKKYGEEYENFSVIVNMEKGEIEIYQEQEVVKKVKDPIVEINLEDALKVEKDLEIGDPFINILNPEDFGRRLINTAKQFLNHKIREIEKENILDKYATKLDSIVTGSVHQIQRDRIFILSNGIELLLPKSEQLPNDRYRRGETIRGVVKSVENTGRGPEIILSRSDNQFLKRLFEMEIPEIEDDIIEVKSVSRSPGDRSKIVVYSSDRRIDAVGACVGMRGNRIQSIVRELNGEKIDIINWSDKPEILVSRALAPAKPIDLYIDEEKPYVVAVFEDEELPIAIGRNGQNIKLASDVSGYNIDAVKKSDHLPSSKSCYLEEIPNFNKKVLEELDKLNIHTSDDFFNTSIEDLLQVKGVGEKTIDKLTNQIKDFLNSMDLATESVEETVDLKEEN